MDPVVMKEGTALAEAAAVALWAMPARRKDIPHLTSMATRALAIFDVTVAMTMPGCAEEAVALATAMGKYANAAVWALVRAKAAAK